MKLSFMTHSRRTGYKVSVHWRYRGAVKRPKIYFFKFKISSWSGYLLDGNFVRDKTHECFQTLGQVVTLQWSTAILNDTGNFLTAWWSFGTFYLRIYTQYCHWRYPPIQLKHIQNNLGLHFCSSKEIIYVTNSRCYVYAMNSSSSRFITWKKQNVHFTIWVKIL